MRKLAVLILCLSFGVVFGQSKGNKKSPETKATEIVGEMDKVVGGLSETQKSELHPLLVRKIESKRTIKKDSSLNEDEKKKQKKALKKDTKAKVQSILTEPQWVKWKAYMKEKRASKKKKKDEVSH
jgi:predicted phage-related endonuclease